MLEFRLWIPLHEKYTGNSSIFVYKKVYCRYWEERKQTSFQTLFIVHFFLIKDIGFRRPDLLNSEKKLNYLSPVQQVLFCAGSSWRVGLNYVWAVQAEETWLNYI